MGSGRFARVLGAGYGVDPARALLAKAGARGVRVGLAAGEGLPFRDKSFRAVCMVLTLCFVDDPPRVLRGAWQVLLPGGRLLLGMVLRGSPWADCYRGLGGEGHPLYRRTRSETSPAERVAGEMLPRRPTRPVPTQRSK